MDSSIKTTNGYTSVENNKKNMSLIINGTETTLKEQISKKIAANQANGLSYNLHQDILVISHSGKSTCVCGEIENQLNSSTVKWNKLIINGEKSVIKEPEIFQKTGIAKIIKAARSAGILRSDFKKNVIWLGLLLVISIVLTWLLSLGHLEYEQFFREKYVLVGSVLYLILFSSYFMFNNYRLQHSIRIRQKLIESANNYKALAEEGNLYVAKVAENILNLEMPMAIVIENIADLDSFTLQVMRELMLSDNNQFVGWILWIIVRNDNSEFENTWLNSCVNKNRVGKIDYCRA